MNLSSSKEIVRESKNFSTNEGLAVVKNEAFKRACCDSFDEGGVRSSGKMVVETESTKSPR